MMIFSVQYSSQRLMVFIHYFFIHLDFFIQDLKSMKFFKSEKDYIFEKKHVVIEILRGLQTTNVFAQFLANIRQSFPIFLLFAK